MSLTSESIFGQFEYWDKSVMPSRLSDPEKLRVVVGCGTSYNLALSIAAVMNASGINAIAVPAGEWVCRPEAYLPAGSDAPEVIALSRSGETTETVQSAISSRAAGFHVIGITCAPGGSLSAASDVAIEFDTHPSEGIVMTASASLMLRAGYALAGLDVDSQLTQRASELLASFDAVSMAPYKARTHFVFLGGGANYGIALEGALKLQEMAICYTQGFHPGEYRRGPVSLVDDQTAIVMIYHPDTKSDEAALVKELQDKGAWVLGIGGPGDLSVDVASPANLIGVEILPMLQLLGERYAGAHGIDTSAPRHLTKVVMLDG